MADMRGLKWRAYSPATGKIAELIGAQPVTIQAAELTQALATGVVESYMSSGSTGYDTKTYEQHQVLVRHPGLAAEERACWSTRRRSTRSTSRPRTPVLKAAADAEERGWQARARRRTTGTRRRSPKRA